MIGLAVGEPIGGLSSDEPRTGCVHCGLPVLAGRRFCCAGCAAAYATIQKLGLGQYYKQRLLDPDARPPRPDSAERWDLERYIVTDQSSLHQLDCAVDGVQCGACVWLIESALAQQPGLLQGRLNMTTRRLHLEWRGSPDEAERFIAVVERLGYRLIPFDAARLAASGDRTGKVLMRALAVAGFAAGNVMLSSVAVWAGLTQGMGPATRDLLHWVSALVAMPAIAYAGMPFFRSAFQALRKGRTNMDVPISVGVCVVTAVSLVETIRGAEHAYFDSAVSLLFFLLIGRVLDHRARGNARATAEELLTLREGDVAVIQADGAIRRRAQQNVAPGDRVLVGSGERVGVDGIIESGSGLLDASLVTGESLPSAAGPGANVFAGMLNIGGPITIRTNATGEATLLAECVRLIEAAESRKSRFVVLADQVARRYAPAVHLCAALTFAWWWGVRSVPFGDAVLTACAVLIVTCPCALALAVPAVQVLATGWLFKGGVLLKSATALERLAAVDTVVLDKTGTLTEPLLALANADGIPEEAMQLAAAMAVWSRHPLSRSLVAAAGVTAPLDGVEEIPGKGLQCGTVRLGQRNFAGVVAPASMQPELWLSRPGLPPVGFRFEERLRPDALATVERLRRDGVRVLLASGDHAAAVEAIARRLGIKEWRAACTPVEKVAMVEALRRDGRHVLMVGDGLNDSPSLAAADVSMSPSSAADISQTVADVVFQGASLAPVERALRVARRTRSVMRQNIGLSIGYNVVMVPLAVAGFVTPWLAAAAMSLSSLSVMGNSFRVRIMPR